MKSNGKANKKSNAKHKIKAVVPGSIAASMAVTPGDLLLSINGNPIRDVFDYRFHCQNECVVLEVLKPDGEIWELDIEKDEDEDLGLIFTRPLMDRAKTCRNKCAFCFIDQLPPDMRDALYVKDDDPRLSFLTGNYVTLTNLRPSDVRQVARYHLSPIRVSVHATDPNIRKRLMGNVHAGRLLRILQILNDAGITLHFQVVLCRGINDGAVLDDTIETLLHFQPGAASLSVVPAGLTRFREGLVTLTPFTPAEAAQVVRQVEQWQLLCKTRHGTAFVFCADEFYIKAGLPLPPYTHYEDFPQLENGVGMTALFMYDFQRALARLKKAKTSVMANTENLKATAGLTDAEYITGAEGMTNAEGMTDAENIAVTPVGVVTGRAAARYIHACCAAFQTVFPAAVIRVYEIENTYFGPEITVSGLLTGRDIVAQIRERVQTDGVRTVLLPRNMFRADKAVTLDDMAPGQLADALGVAVKISGKTSSRKTTDGHGTTADHRTAADHRTSTDRRTTADHRTAADHFCRSLWQAAFGKYGKLVK